MHSINPANLRDMQKLIHKIQELDQEKSHLRQVNKKDGYSKKCIDEILNNIPAPIYLKDTHGAYIFINKKYEELANVRLADIVGKSDFDIFPEPVARLFKSQDEEVIRKNKPVEFEETITLPDGVHTFITSKFPLYGKDGEISAVVGISPDITKRKQAEEELNKYRCHLEEMVTDRTLELEQHILMLEEANIALRVLMEHRVKDKKEIEKNVYNNVVKLVFPYLDKLKGEISGPKGNTYLGILESNLKKITDLFSPGLSKQISKLTPAELQIANLIKHSKTSKEIADLLNLSIRTINFHRENIRDKLDLKNQKVNLRSHLMDLI